MIRATLMIIIASIIFAAVAQAETFEEKYGKMISDQTALASITQALSKFKPPNAAPTSCAIPPARRKLRSRR